MHKILFLSRKNGFTVRSTQDGIFDSTIFAIQRNVELSMVVSLSADGVALDNAALDALTWEAQVCAEAVPSQVLLIADSVAVSGNTLVIAFDNTNSVALSNAIRNANLIPARLYLAGIPDSAGVPEQRFDLRVVVTNSPSPDPATIDPVIFYTKAEADARFFSAISAGEAAEASATTAENAAATATTKASAASASAQSAATDAATATDKASLSNHNAATATEKASAAAVSADTAAAQATLATEKAAAAATSAINAAASAATAATKADNASASATAANSSAQNAAASENSAAASATTATTQATSASVSATNAAASEAAAAASQTAAGNSAASAAASEANAASSAVAAATSESNAAASAANAQNAKLLRYELEVANLKYSAALGYYADLTNANDTVKTVYNVADCSSVALHLKSANSAITGNISLEVGGHTFAVEAGASGAWVELALDGGFSGRLEVKLLSGLTDAGAPVSVIVDGMRVACDYRAAAFGFQSRQVAARPVLYSDAAGYYMSLDAAYSVTFAYPVTGLTAVALKLRSANSAITGNAALTLTVGAVTKSAVVAVGAADAWALITLDAPASGAVAVVRDTTNAADTLNDSGTVVSAVVSDLNYYYQEN